VIDFAPLVAAALVGLFSLLHCVGMCGGIMGALTFGLAPELRGRRGPLLLFILAYNLGRILSYTLAGAMLGSVGLGLFAMLSPEWGYLVMQLLAALMLAGIGLYLGGWFPQFALIERIGQPLWQRLEPLGRRMLPVRTPLQALLYGMLWGWLPCGMVYSVLLWSMSSGGPAEGALLMAAFGVGTLPAIVGVGFGGSWLARVSRRPQARRLAGASLILFAVAGPLLVHTLYPHGLPFGPLQPGCTTDESL